MRRATVAGTRFDSGQRARLFILGVLLMATDFLGVATKAMGDPNAMTTTDYLGAEVPLSLRNPATLPGGQPDTSPGVAAPTADGMTDELGEVRQFLGRSPFIFEGEGLSAPGVESIGGDTSGEGGTGTAPGLPAISEGTALQGFNFGPFSISPVGNLSLNVGRLSESAGLGRGTGSFAQLAANLAGIPTATNVISAVAPAAAAVLGPAGIGIGAFTMMTDVANAIASRLGVSTRDAFAELAALANEPDPEGIAAKLDAFNQAIDAVMSGAPFSTADPNLAAILQAALQGSNFAVFSDPTTNTFTAMNMSPLNQATMNPNNPNQSLPFQGLRAAGVVGPTGEPDAPGIVTSDAPVDITESGPNVSNPTGQGGGGGGAPDGPSADGPASGPGQGAGEGGTGGSVE